MTMKCQIKVLYLKSTVARYICRITRYSLQHRIYRQLDRFQNVECFYIG